MSKVAGVMGLSHDTTPEQEAAAERLGEALAEKGYVVLTGATDGLPYEAAKGAKRKGATVIGISPAADAKEHVEVFRKPLEHHDHIIYTGLGLIGRNMINIRTSDIVFVLAGGIGTLNEFTVAFQSRKPIGILTGHGGIADSIKPIIEELGLDGRTIIYDDDPRSLVERMT
jgi:uncharacterized protein (TIGR00725 family)